MGESTQWFRRTLEKLVKDDEHGKLSLNHHVTGIKAKADTSESAGLHLAESVAKDAEHGEHVVSEVSSKIGLNFGRPNFKAIFQDIIDKHPNKDVGVFYCGPPALGSVLRRTCQTFSSKYGTNFDYFQEHF